MVSEAKPMIQETAHDEGSIRELRLTRPPVNALNLEMLREIGAKVEHAAREAAVIVVSGQPGVFSAGLDVPALLKLDRDAVTEVFVELWRAQRAIAYCPVPVVFALTGHCPAGGTVLAIHGDYRLLARGDFRIGLNEVQVGLFPGDVIYGAFARLTGGHAAQLLTRGALLDPATALRVGLVDELAESTDVVARGLVVAREYRNLPREPMLRTRALARAGLMALFGSPEHASIREREFGALGAEAWFAVETQEMLRKSFVKRSTG
jgi:enoyl-CoA hydratase/carnithine racemase